MTLLAHSESQVDNEAVAMDLTRSHASSLIAQVVRTMRDEIAELAAAMQAEDLKAIPELLIDPPTTRLLHASIVGNLDALLYVVEGSIAVTDVEPPAAATCFARRLAQRGRPSAALLNAYRRNERHFVDTALLKIGSSGPNGDTALAAAQIVYDLSFAYFAKVTAKLSNEYEHERERWLSHDRTIPEEVLEALLVGDDSATSIAAGTLGYDTHQNHVGVIVWSAGAKSNGDTLAGLERLVAEVGTIIGAAGTTAFVPRDMTLGWGWIPLGDTDGTLDAAAIDRIRTAAGDDMHVALGTVGRDAAGFRSTHVESSHAFTVASIANGQPPTITSYGEPGVAAAAMLAGDLASARGLVARALGGLAADDERTRLLRETLLALIEVGGSPRVAAAQLKVHPNTVVYRLAKAEKGRGRPLDEDRLDLHLALVACRWLGRDVLPPSGGNLEQPEPDRAR